MNSVQLSRFERDGYLRVVGVLEPAAVVEPLFAEYEQVLDRLAHELRDRGEIASTHADLGFAERLIRIYRESGRDHSRYFDPSLLTRGVTPDTPFWAGPAVFRIITHESVLDLVECLIGPEIYSNPVQHIRIKPPERLLPDGATDVLARANPWHQDNGVVDPVADGSDMLTVWIALSDAPVERGCLQVIPGSHRQALRTHCPNIPGRPLAIPDALLDLDRATPVPVRSGDVILMHRHTIHGSLPNVSDDIRWSLDLRYNPTGQPTGRPEFPGFIARSRRDPDSELRDPEAWAKLWSGARDRLAVHPPTKPAHRWRGTEPVCA
ncbi:MAG: phytanoyl-CoA dioxygenase family protein [Spirochaetaceae bacterium]|nr:phytanoyl-CoA dioxygenase family protein [Spirochaetaceae bacterium]